MANDLEMTSRKMANQSRKSRPATDGNKNVHSRARRKGSKSMTKDGMVGQSHKGPDLGSG